MWTRLEAVAGEELPPHSIGLLDGFRGLLAVWVFMSHALAMNGVTTGVLSHGGIAVDLFMLVSGFLMVWNVELRSTKEPIASVRTWGKFYLRRFFRIAPLYYLAFAAAFIWRRELAAAIDVAHAHGGMSDYRPFGHCGDEGMGNIFAHVSFLFGLFPCYSSSDFLPDWSLTLEVQFYLLFPLIFFALLLWPRLVFAAATLLIVALSMTAIGVYDMVPGKWISFPQPSLLVLRLNCFGTGMLMALMYYRARWSITSWIALAAMMALWQRNTFTVLALGLCVVLFCVRYGSNWPRLRPVALGVSKVLSRQPLKWMGDVSYGLYLLHLFILVPVVNALWGQAWFAGMGSVARILVTIFAALPIAFLLAGVAHVLIEKPMIAFGRAQTRRIGT